MKIPCAIIGLGRIGSLLEADPLREKPCTHAGAIVDNPQCHLVGGYDIDSGRRAQFAETWKVPTDFSSAEVMMDTLHPMIVHIATHPDSHAYYVELAARKNVKVVVCEKPLADSLTHAQRIVRLHRSKKIKVLTNHERRYSLDYLHTQKRIQEKAMGNLLSIYGRLYFGRTTTLATQMLHDGTHLVDIISFLVGSRLKQPTVEGNLHKKKGTAFIHTKSVRGGIPICIEVGAERDHLVFELILSFTSGRIEIGNGFYREYGSKESPFYEGYRSLIPQSAPTFHETGYFRNMMSDAVACALDPDRYPISSAEHGAEALRFILSLGV
ncbi:MAG: Gfo/Idh/MocA family oxidoreductase [Spirochaetes bacterium]|nr:Gfo/Idh/MocA family oxidoreductase [Spirochaetota bacterium]